MKYAKYLKQENKEMSLHNIFNLRLSGQILKSLSLGQFNTKTFLLYISTFCAGDICLKYHNRTFVHAHNKSNVISIDKNNWIPCNNMVIAAKTRTKEGCITKRMTIEQ